MPNRGNSKNVYVPGKYVDMLENIDLSFKEIIRLAVEGRKLFELLQLTPAAEEYLSKNRKLMEVIEKW